MFFKNNSYQLNKFVFYIFLFFIGFNLKAQENLVPNGSFEILIDCPFGNEIQFVSGWFNPSEATPDIFNNCIDLFLNYSVPVNGFGYQEALDGVGYIGIVPYGFGTDYREYIACKLTKTLIQNKIYQVSYFVNLANVSPLACDNFGVAFSSDSSHFNTTNIITLNSVLESELLVEDTVDWIKISFYFEAKGNENYLFIGNFSSDENTAIKTVNTTLQECYYFVDLVSLTEVEFSVENCFTPNNDGVNEIVFQDTTLVDDFTVKIFNRWGNEINEVRIADGWDGTDVSGKLMSEGVYFYQIFFKKRNKIKNGFIHLIR